MMKVKEREQYWRDVVQDWASSGEMLAGFARQRKISYGTLWNWKVRFEDEGAGRKLPTLGSASRTAISSDIVPVRLVDTPPVAQRQLDTGGIISSQIKVSLCSEHVLRFDQSYPLGFLAGVVSTLECR
jgi:hypothetical protein